MKNKYSVTERLLRIEAERSRQNKEEIKRLKTEFEKEINP